MYDAAKLFHFILAIMWLVGVLFVLGVLSVIVIFLIARIRVWLWQRSVARDEREDYESKHTADGRKLPDFDRGICDNCERLCPKVYYLENGKRLCEKCYKEFDNA
ncbi:MAG: hypothetical protein JW936_03640 [Sedimentisphaerales bacterium]|nr:hypothetical protein [Sedimentisphaerales bacterium]